MLKNERSCFKQCPTRGQDYELNTNLKTMEQEAVMRYMNRLMVTALVMAGVQITACQKHASTHKAEHPATIEKIEGSDLSRVILTERAMQRLDVKTDQVRAQGGQMVVPYSSLIYDPKGQTWVYTSPAPRTFIRQKVEIDRITGDSVILNDGPPAGTVVATVAVAEIYGTELKVGH
jgi:outer membrane receptor for ferric coprogen and ferric-rhodotorulic acid